MDTRKIRRKAKERAGKTAADASAEGAAERRARSIPTATPTPTPTATATPTSTSTATPTSASTPTADPNAALPTFAPALAPPPPLEHTVLTAVDVLEGELAALLRGDVPGPFRTWRPGSDPVPFFPPPGEEPMPLEEEPAPAARDGARSRRRDRGGDPLDEFLYRPDEAGPDLPDLGEPEEPGTSEAEAPEVLEEYLTFFLGGEEYGLAIATVREVIQAPPITEVPRAPLGILGVVTVRGEVVIVYDPRTRLALAPGSRPEGGRIVVLREGEAPSALLVDHVAGVVRLPPREVEPTPQGLGGVQADTVVGIGHARDRIFTILDVAALLRRPPWPGWDGRPLGDAA
jgi:purine-binding chemotaxis protein CheW